jgi:DNA-binding transcriptional LysR family regulator
MRSAEQISRRVKLRHLSALLAVVEQGSMAKAARQLAVTQPVVSKAISDLEKIVGLPLLERRPRGVEPTAYGRALLKRSIAIFDDLCACLSELEFLADPAAGELRIGSTEAMGSGLIPAIIDRMSRQYPRVVFDVVLADPETLQERELRGRRVDLVIGQRVMPGFGDDLDVTVLYRETMYVVTGLDSPWARRRKIALAELVNERWCLPPPTHPVGMQVLEAFQRSGLQPPRGIVTAPSAPFTSNLIANGQFLGVLGSVFLGVHAGAARLKVLPVRLPIPMWPISIVTLKNRALSPVAKLFIDCAREVAKPLANARMRR